MPLINSLEMKILTIGDPHGDLESVKKIPIKGVDLILLTGDLGSANLMRKIAFEDIEREKKGLPLKDLPPRREKRAYMEGYTSSLKIVKYLAKHAPVYTIFGNVEKSNAKTKKASKRIGLPLPYLTDALNKIPGVRVINDKLVNFHGIRIGGLQYFVDTNWVRDFKPKDKKLMKYAKKHTDNAKKVLKRFGKVDILLFHQPPYMVLDMVRNKAAPKHWQGKYAGSEVILAYIKKMQPRYGFCGHIHEGQGMEKIGKSEIYNLGVCNYKLVVMK